MDILKQRMVIDTWFFDSSVDENKEVLKKYAYIWNGIKNKMKAINVATENDYEKDYMKIKFNSDNDLPLN